MIDATGQDAFLARANRTVQPLKGFGCVAVFRHYDGIAPEIFDELTVTGNIKVLMVPDGWMWLIPLAGRASASASSAATPISSPETLDAADRGVTDHAAADRGRGRHRAAHHPQLQLPQPARLRPPLGLRGRRLLLSRPGVLVGRVAGDAERGVAGRQAVGRAARRHRGRSRAARRAREADGDRLPQLRGDRLPLLSRGAGAPAVLPGHGGRSRCAPGSPASSAAISGATTIRSSRCCCARSARRPGRPKLSEPSTDVLLADSGMPIASSITPVIM